MGARRTRGRRATCGALAAFSLAACGSGLTAHQSAPASSNPPTTAAGAAAAPDSGGAGGSQSKTFTVVLKRTSGLPGHAPASHASLSATLRLEGGQGKFCWSFTRVVGVRRPTSAHINFAAYAPGTGGYAPSGNVVIQLGAKYAPSGCVAISSGVATQLVAVPASFYLAVDSANYPDGALRGLL